MEYCTPVICELPTVKYYTPDEILEKGCLFFGIEPKEIKTRWRKREIAELRHMIMDILRKKTELSLTVIGEMFNRDHTTVMYASKVVADLCETDDKFKAKYEALNKFIFS